MDCNSPSTHMLAILSWRFILGRGFVLQNNFFARVRGSMKVGAVRGVASWGTDATESDGRDAKSLASGSS